MQITAEMVKTLREATNAGLMDCRKALTEANGDMKEAEKILKKMGLATIAKRAERATENGRIAVFASKDSASLISVACETDFVARNDSFKKMADEIAKYVAENKIDKEDDKIKGLVNDLISTIKENMSIKKILRMNIAKGEGVSSYIHADGAMGCLVKFKSDNADCFSNEKVKSFMHDIALHITAYQPQYVCAKDVDEKFKAEQIEIFKAQVATLNKPDKVKEGIVNGKLSSLLNEICLLNQGFVKDPNVTVEKMCADVSKECGCKLEIAEYFFVKAGV